MALGLCACTEPAVPETPNNGAENPGGDDTNTELPPEDGENNGENQEPDEGGEGGIPDPDPTPVTYQFNAENIKSAKIVYVPRDYATGGVIDTAIDNLISTINTRFTCKIIKTNDQTIASSDTLKEYEYEIVIGNTKRDASKNNLTDLLYCDWGYKIDGTKIVIKGGSQEALATAINKFRTAISGVKEKGVFYTSEMDTINRANLAGKDLLINGTPISEFSIVYPANGTAFEKELARRLSDYITTISGYVIPFYSNVQKKPAAHEIMIGVPADRSFTVLTKQGAAVEADKNHVAIVGETAYDYGLAQQELSSLLYAAAMGTKTLSLPDKTAVNGETEKIKIMAYNVYGADYYDSRCDNIRRLVTKYLPDILAYQEPDVTMTNKIRLDGYYEWFDGKPRHTRPDGTVIGGTGGANSIGPIGYAKDRFAFVLGDTKWCTGTPDVASKLPNSDYYRMFTYAMLRDQQTGEEFIVVNWHLDFNSDVQVAQVNYMFKFFNDNYNDIPVIMLGDFNASSESMVVSGTVKKFGGFASLHEMASNKEASNPAGIDWIFAMNCCVKGTYYKWCRETYPDKQASVGKAYGDGKYPSDHCPVYAELTIRSDRAEHTHDWSHNASQVEWQTQPTVPVRTN
jgi:endonuclease/exonuclease/phosphatase family metal-dependent hydrolase